MHHGDARLLLKIHTLKRKKQTDDAFDTVDTLASKSNPLKLIHVSAVLFYIDPVITGSCLVG